MVTTGIVSQMFESRNTDLLFCTNSGLYWRLFISGEPSVREGEGRFHQHLIPQCVKVSLMDFLFVYILCSVKRFQKFSESCLGCKNLFSGLALVHLFIDFSFTCLLYSIDVTHFTLKSASLQLGPGCPGLYWNLECIHVRSTCLNICYPPCRYRWWVVRPRREKSTWWHSRFIAFFIYVRLN
jgi:hypothetical protein